MEVQSHGILFENEIIYRITGKTKAEYQKLIDGAYTSSLDIHKGQASDANYSIKTCKDATSVMCGDILRFINHCKDTEFTMIIGCYKQINKQTKLYNEIYEFYIDPKQYEKIWQNLTLDIVKPFVDYVKSIPEGKAAQMENRKLWKEKRNKIYEDYGGKGIISIDAKIDSKNQRRVQCSFRIKDFVDIGVPYAKFNIDYKGLKLPYEQESSPRQFSRA